MRAASLPMYDLAEVRAATEAWWDGLARHFVAAGMDQVSPDLARPDDLMTHWLSPDLLFSQTCGYPLTHELAGRVHLIATPRYDAEGCVGPNYSSLVVVAADDPVTDIAGLRGKRCAINSYGSQSGCNALRTLLAPVAGSRGFFSEVLVSGGHPFSLEMIQRGEADVAAIDCVTHGLFAAHAPHRLEGTRVLCRTASTPALPFISARATRPDDVARLRDGLCAAVADAGLAETRAALLIADVEVLSLDVYDCIPRMVQAALDTGFTDLSPPDA